MDPARIALGRVLISLHKYSEAASVVLEYTVANRETLRVSMPWVRHMGD